jgi:hypothetical protein
VHSLSGLVAFTYAGYVAAGYAITVLGLGGYFAHLLHRSRRARARAAALAAKRTASG